MGADPESHVVVDVVVARAVVRAVLPQRLGSTDVSGYTRSAGLTAALTPPTCDGVALPIFGSATSNSTGEPFAPFTLGRDYLIAGTSPTILRLRATYILRSKHAPDGARGGS